MTIFKLIENKYIVDNRKKSIVTCPFNKHSHCEFSCPLVFIQKDHDGLDKLYFICGRRIIKGTVEVASWDPGQTNIDEPGEEDEGKYCP